MCGRSIGRRLGRKLRFALVDPLHAAIQAFEQVHDGAAHVAGTVQLQMKERRRSRPGVQAGLAERLGATPGCRRSMAERGPERIGNVPRIRRAGGQHLARRGDGFELQVAAAHRAGHRIGRHQHARSPPAAAPSHAPAAPAPPSPAAPQPATAARCAPAPAVRSSLGGGAGGHAASLIHPRCHPRRDAIGAHARCFRMRPAAHSRAAALGAIGFKPGWRRGGSRRGDDRATEDEGLSLDAGEGVSPGG